jgi:decaprenylphospho-beta-D-erythro-pentofuranosid-2-ulose 2-reductase
VSETKTVLILGGVSDMGLAIARKYAVHGWKIVLAARDGEFVERNVSDLALRHGASVSAARFDACRTGEHAAFLDGLGVLPDTAISVVGFLGRQEQAQSDTGHATEILRANFEGPALLLGLIAERMTARGSGTIVGISSVAGDRGRGSNYVYGSAKAGFTAFLSGLRNRLAAKGVHVLTVKPGFVNTSMTAGLELPKPLTAEPEEVGKAVYVAAEVKKRNVIYVRPIWRLIVALIVLLPESVFKKLSL